jgi:acyl carrier protein
VEGIVTDSDRVVSTVRKFLQRQKKDDTVGLDTGLFAEGMGLDSLQTAELSVMLEDELGRDPFSEGALPQTIAEIVDFYEDPKA